MNKEDYNLLCDDLYLDMYVNTELELPSQRDTILTFFERIGKQYPSMSNFYRRDPHYYLEEENSSGQYRWVALEGSRIGSGIVNPERFEEAYSQGKFVLELIPYMLGVNFLDIDSLDVTIGMDFDYWGNHDEVIAEALLGTGPLNCLLDLPSSRVVDCSPSIVVSLSEDNRTQARISVESKTTIFDPREKESGDGGPDKFISLLFTIRQYPQAGEKFDPIKSFEKQCRLAEELLAGKIASSIVQPLVNTIAQKRFI
jgi:hypothetical protein